VFFSWEKDFDKEFAVGSSITVKFPWRPSVSDGMGYAPQAITRASTTISLDQWLQIGFEWDDYERAVKLERSEAELRENYYEPCAASLAQEFDSRRCNSSGHSGEASSPASVIRELRRRPRARVLHEKA
jgi:hypothetical protein